MTKRWMHYLNWLITVLVLSASLAHAQTRQTQAAQVESAAAEQSEFRFSDLLAQNQKNRLGFSLMAAPRNTDAGKSNFNLTPLAAGTNLPVVGSGISGRLTKWTGFTGSNAVIGDSTIFEDKNGLVGIGTDAPTSKLTVAGMIQITLGGLKFPDGTVQTTASLASVIHDGTLTGNGTNTSPLGVAAPLNLTGAAAFTGIIKASNTAPAGIGVLGHGGNGDDVNNGGNGMLGLGGFSNNPMGSGGRGMEGQGGQGNPGDGGIGVAAFGGGSTSGGAGGDGVGTVGGSSPSGGRGGRGVFAIGGNGQDSNNRGGTGVFGRGGFGVNGASDGLAAEFQGDVEITGNLSKGGGSFKIDHPLDPENKYLYHSFVESPDMKNIYDGNATTDANGEAMITLPDWFEALNRDFRYQLTVIGTFAQAIVADEIKDNHFKIKTNAPNVKVSWQVTGIRQDAYANKHRIPVEEAKTKAERGTYLHPDAFNQPEERGVEWARQPQLMQQMKATREKQLKELKDNAQKNEQ